MITKKQKNVLITLVALILLVNMVHAFGVAGYSSNIRIRPGEGINLSFEMQNMAGDQDLSIEYRITGEEGIEVSLLDNVTAYDMPLGSRVRANFRVNMPKNTEMGKNFTVSGQFYANPKSNEQNGPLGIRTGMGIKATIQSSDVTDDTGLITPKLIEPVVETPKSNLGKIIALITLVLITVAVYFYVHRKNNSKDGTSKKEEVSN